MWKIISPSNFPADSHLVHGSTVYAKKLPDWAKNNPKVVVEQIGVIETEEEEVSEEIVKESAMGSFYCLSCEGRFSTEAELQQHFIRVHIKKKSKSRRKRKNTTIRKKSIKGRKKK